MEVQNDLLLYFPSFEKCISRIKAPKRKGEKEPKGTKPGIGKRDKQKKDEKKQSTAGGNETQYGKVSCHQIVIIVIWRRTNLGIYASFLITCKDKASACFRKMFGSEPSKAKKDFCAKLLGD